MFNTVSLVPFLLSLITRIRIQVFTLVFLSITISLSALEREAAEPQLSDNHKLFLALEAFGNAKISEIYEQSLEKRRLQKKEQEELEKFTLFTRQHLEEIICVFIKHSFSEKSYEDRLTIIKEKFSETVKDQYQKRNLY